MSMELITVMSYGTLSSVSVWMVIISNIRNGVDAFTYSAPFIVLYMLGTTFAVAVPFKMVQRVLDMASQTRVLLLKPQLQQSQLHQELSLFREAVGHDLDTLGDLGLFRLQTSTILSITATVLTYIIVMVQFIMTELSEKPTVTTP